MFPATPTGAADQFFGSRQFEITSVSRFDLSTTLLTPKQRRPAHGTCIDSLDKIDQQNP